MMNVRLTVAYDGTNYSGWQRQDNAVSVQEMLEKALQKLLGHDVTINGAGRTDAGVHALAQAAAFKSETLNNIPIEKLPQVINSLLPNDITVKDAQFADEDFHPRYSAKNKTYRYQILNTKYPDPLLRNYTMHVPQPLDFGSMCEAAKHFSGTHDFKAFSASGGNYKTTVRTVYYITLTEEAGLITILINGNAFLYNMVRIISGTLIAVGKQKIKPSEIEGILLSQDRTLAGMTAKACGLTLVSVEF